MRLSILQQTLREVRQPLLRWTLVIAGAAWLVLLAHPLFLFIGKGSLAAELFPPWLVFLLGGANDLTELGNWVRQVGLGLVLPVLLIIYSVWQGSWLVAGEEERGSLGLLLAAPLRRDRLIMEKFAVLILLVLAPSAGLWLALSPVGWIGWLDLSGIFLFQAVLVLFCLTLLFGALAFALGSLTGKRRLSQNVVLFLAGLAFSIIRLPGGFPGLPVLRLLSPFYFYGQALGGHLFALHLLVLVGLIVVCLGLAWMAFERRDLAV